MTKFSELLLSEEGSTMLFENIYISKWKSELITIICRFAWCDGNHHCWLTREHPHPHHTHTLCDSIRACPFDNIRRVHEQLSEQESLRWSKSNFYSIFKLIISHSLHRQRISHSLDTVPIRVNKRWTKIVSWVSKKCTQCTLASRSESYLSSFFFFSPFSRPPPPRRVECSSRHLGYIRNSSSLSAWKIELNAFLHFHFILIIHRCKFLLRLSAPRSFAHLKKSLSRFLVCASCARQYHATLCHLPALTSLSSERAQRGRVIECRWYFEAERNEKWKSENRKSRSRQSKIGDRHGDDDYGWFFFCTAKREKNGTQQARARRNAKRKERNVDNFHHHHHRAFIVEHGLAGRLIMCIWSRNTTPYSFVACSAPSRQWMAQKNVIIVRCWVSVLPLFCSPSAPKCII